MGRCIVRQFWAFSKKQFRFSFDVNGQECMRALRCLESEDVSLHYRETRHVRCDLPPTNLSKHIFASLGRVFLSTFRIQSPAYSTS